ncbi:MAG: tetratricopeptide repeat protein [Alphaproteobacteria bacterium]|nr:tetratricopeptide repeat protein [Alphaproteobacteria bacterium]
MTTDPALLAAARDLHKAGDIAEAARRYRALADADPDNAELCHLLAVVAVQEGRYDDAIDGFSRAIERDPSIAKFHGNLAVAYLATGRLERALAHAERAVALDAGEPGYRNTQGTILRSLGRTEEAVAALRAAVARAPDDAEALNNLAATLFTDGAVDEALAIAEGLVRRLPASPEMRNTYALALQAKGEVEKAANELRRAIALAPSSAEPYRNLGLLMEEKDRLTEAEGYYRKLVELGPDEAAGHGALAGLLRKAGRTEDALEHYRRAVALAPGSAVHHSNLLFALLADPTIGNEALLDEHRGWAARHGADVEPVAAEPPDPVPDRRLRVGYVSPDFRRHPVGYMVLPALANHDPAAVEVFCYASRPSDDAVTARIRATVPHWGDITRLGDGDAAAMIAHDRIDILIDLAGHTAGNRLGVFARRPAPVQATWAGYAMTTGLPAIDYLIGDAAQMPPGSEADATETLVRLPRTGLCIAPPDEAPPVAPLPASSRGVVTFGSLNNPAKIVDPVLDVWARVLAAVPGARLLLRYRGLQDTGVQTRLRDAFAARGIAPDRIDLRGGAPRGEFLATYDEIDIALDTFPYSGAMTTFEALWMGVPVVSLYVDRMVGRQSASILAAAGHAGLVAPDDDTYVAHAVRLAADLGALARMRAGLRGRVAASPLCDGIAFARDLEAAYRTMWRTWCARMA